MAIKSGDFIKLNYTGMVDGVVFDTTDAEKAKEADIYHEEKAYEPIVIRIGAAHVIPGLDEALEGAEIGKDGEVEIEAEKAYGLSDESLIKSAPTKNFNEKPVLGARVQADGREGVVVNVVGKRAVVDFNHPLAGKALKYSFNVESIVENPKEQAKAIIKLFSGRAMELSIKKGDLTIDLPAGINYDKNWNMGRGMAVYQIFQYIESVQNVILKETFKRPEEAAEETPVEEAPAEETPAEEKKE